MSRLTKNLKSTLSKVKKLETEIPKKNTELKIANDLSGPIKLQSEFQLLKVKVVSATSINGLS